MRRHLDAAWVLALASEGSIKMFFRGRTRGLHPPKPKGFVARGSGSRKRMTIAAPLAPIIALCFCLNTTTTAAQASQTQSNPQSNQGQTQAQQQDVPDAP